LQRLQESNCARCKYFLRNSSAGAFQRQFHQQSCIEFLIHGIIVRKNITSESLGRSSCNNVSGIHSLPRLEINVVLSPSSFSDALQLGRHYSSPTNFGMKLECRPNLFPKVELDEKKLPDGCMKNGPTDEIEA